MTELRRGGLRLKLERIPGDVQLVRLGEDVVGLEYVGNVNNSGANSSQFGYFSYVTQLPAFNGTPEDAAHANITFSRRRSQNV